MLMVMLKPLMKEWCDGVSDDYDLCHRQHRMARHETDLCEEVGQTAVIR